MDDRRYCIEINKGLFSSNMSTNYDKQFSLVYCTFALGKRLPEEVNDTIQTTLACIQLRNALEMSAGAVM